MIWINALVVSLVIFGTKFVAVDSTSSSSALVCEGSQLTIKCDKGLINVIKANYGRLSSCECNFNGIAPIYTTNCMSTNSVEIVKAKCSNKPTCSVHATNEVFGDPCFDTHKYLEVEYQCIESTSAHVCEGNMLNITCDKGLIDVIEANYGRLSRSQCTHNDNEPQPIYTTICISPNSLNILKAQCSNKPSCSVQAKNEVFGDPCDGTSKYLQVEYRCIENREYSRTAIVCEVSNLSIACEPGETIIILDANYGRTSSARCGSSQNTKCKSPNSFEIVSLKCTGEEKCTVSATNNVFGDPCDGTPKYLEVKYVCVKRRPCKGWVF